MVVVGGGDEQARTGVRGRRRKRRRRRTQEGDSTPGQWMEGRQALGRQAGSRSPRWLEPYKYQLRRALRLVRPIMAIHST